MTDQHRLERSNKDFKNVTFFEKCYNSKCNAIRLNRKSRFDENVNVMIVNGSF